MVDEALLKFGVLIVGCMMLLSATNTMMDNMQQRMIEKINPKWQSELISYPATVVNGSSYDVVCRVQNNLPIKDTVNIMGYLWRTVQENISYYTVAVVWDNSSITLDGKASYEVHGVLNVPSHFVPGSYLLSCAVTYEDVEPWIYRDVKGVEVQ
jgi:hypothetical protein